MAFGLMGACIMITWVMNGKNSILLTVQVFCFLFLRFLDIPVAIISGEDTEIVRKRAEKLNIKHLYLGVKNKVIVAEKLCKELDINLSEVAYIGDDINDIQLLKKVGLSAAPDNAPLYVKDIVDLKLKVKGGDGAFREFIEIIINRFSNIDLVLEQYYKSLSNRANQ